MKDFDLYNPKQSLFCKIESILTLFWLNKALNAFYEETGIKIKLLGDSKNNEE